MIQNTDYNRVLKLINLQLEQTNKTLLMKGFNDIYVLLKENLEHNNYNHNKILIQNDEVQNRISLNSFFEWINKEIQPIREIILTADTLSIEEKKQIGEYISNNLEDGFGITIKRFIQLCEKYFQENEFIERIDEDKEWRLRNLETAKDIYSILYPTDN